MPRTCRLIAMLAFLLTVVLLSGCYTMLGSPSVVDQGITREEIIQDQDYEYHGLEYGYPGSYYQSYYDFWYPGSYYYWNSPRRYYNDYPGRRYDDGVVPARRPENRRRGSSDPQRYRRSGHRGEANPEQDEDQRQSERESTRKQRTESRSRKPSAERRDTGTEKSSTRTKPGSEQEEEETTGK